MIWSPLLDPEFEKPEFLHDLSLDWLRAGWGVTGVDATEGRRIATGWLGKDDGQAMLMFAELDRMAVAEKLAPLGDLPARVLASDDVMCRVCGEPDRTCECEA